MVVVVNDDHAIMQDGGAACAVWCLLCVRGSCLGSWNSSEPLGTMPLSLAFSLSLRCMTESSIACDIIGK